MLSPLPLQGTRHLAPLRDRDLVAPAESLRTDPSLVARLCALKSLSSANNLAEHP